MFRFIVNLFGVLVFIILFPVGVFYDFDHQDKGMKLLDITFE